jgi:hypothetical protein
MNSGIFRRWLTENGCIFEGGKNRAIMPARAYVTVRRGSRRMTLWKTGLKKPLDPKAAKYIARELGLDWSEAPRFRRDDLR